MSSTVAGRAKRTRDRLRALHMIAGILLVVSVYVPPPSGSIGQLVLQWIIAPTTVLVGVLMWQWPALRRLGRRSGPGRGGRPAVGVGDNAA
jgi:hypothetical protein